MPPTRVIGIDAGGTKLLGGVVDDELVVHHRVHRMWRGADRAETLEIFVEAVEEVRAAAPDVAAVGFGIPSLVDSRTGASVWSNHLPLDGVPFRDLMVALGTGIGGGILIDGRIYRGATGVGAELGHVVVDIDGGDCPGDCPGRGCLEVLVSGNAIGVEGVAAAGARPESALGRRLAGGGAITGGLVTDLAHSGDSAAREVLAIKP